MTQTKQNKKGGDSISQIEDGEVYIKFEMTGDEHEDKDIPSIIPEDIRLCGKTDGEVKQIIVHKQDMEDFAYYLRDEINFDKHPQFDSADEVLEFADMIEGDK